MAECRRFVCSGCGRKIDAWSDGNPFYIDETGKKQYAYHPDLQADWRNLERKSLKRDIYPRELIPGELQRSQTMELIPGVFLPVVSRTDAAISKLIWIDKGSQRSCRDFRSIFRSGSEIQQADIRAQAEKIRLSKLRDEVLSESDEIR